MSSQKEKWKTKEGSVMKVRKEQGRSIEGPGKTGKSKDKVET